LSEPAVSPVSRDEYQLPPFQRGMRIGLFGGSFDPAHRGHVEVSLTALRALRLDQVWWLVSPRNPLKNHAPANDLASRIARARRITRHPNIRITGIEARLATSTSAQTLDRLLPLLPGVDLVWMIGADNLASLHRWQDWKSIPQRLPLAVFNRPGTALSALASPAARTFARYRIGARDSAGLARSRPPAWVFLPSPNISLSSSRIRADDR